MLLVERTRFPRGKVCGCCLSEAAVAELPDARTLPVAPSLEILAGIHARWVALGRALEPEQWEQALRRVVDAGVPAQGPGTRPSTGPSNSPSTDRAA